jgi:PEP-CTERM motif-containing protein
MRALKSLLLLFAVATLLAGSAFADKCDSFSGFNCAKKVTDQAFLTGTGFDNSLPVSVVLGSSMFTVGIHGGSLAGDTLLIAAAFANGMSGTLTGSNGVTSGFTSLGAFPEQGAMGAITGTWSALNIQANNVVFGFANLGTVNTSTLSITTNGIANGTVLYAIVVNSKGQIINITANSEAGTLGVVATPEPGSLILLGTGMVGLAGLVRRKMSKS